MVYTASYTPTDFVAILFDFIGGLLAGAASQAFNYGVLAIVVVIIGLAAVAISRIFNIF